MRWILFLAASALAAQTTVVRTTTLIDGKGHVLRNQDIAIENGRIMSIGPSKGKPTIDLTGGLDR